MSSEKRLHTPAPMRALQTSRQRRKACNAASGGSKYTHPHDNSHAPVLPLSVVFAHNSEIAIGTAVARPQAKAGLQSRRKRLCLSGALTPGAKGFDRYAADFAAIQPSAKRWLSVLRFLIATSPRSEFPVSLGKQKGIQSLIATRIGFFGASYSARRAVLLPLIFALFAAHLALVTLEASAVEASNLLRAQQRAEHPAVTAVALQDPGIPELFREGEAALRAGQLDRAEAAFTKVLAADPHAAGAYANLGVIAMRKQQWQQALGLLRKAAHLAPQVAGIRLNIGLVYYRQNEFQEAIAPFASVVRDQPQSVQARYLLGLCYFFTEQYADAVRLLDPLWPQEMDDLNYLYVLGNAANKVGKSDVEDRALARFVELGQNTAEYHMLMGKAALNRGEDQKPIAELQKAVELDPNLPYVHFNLGLAYMARADFEHARDEFVRDVAIEPDVAFDYDRLGTAYSYLQDDAKAEENFKEALRRDSHLASSYFGLARLYQREGKFAEALDAVNSADKIDPDNSNYHNLKGQILIHMGKTQEGQAELQKATQLLEASRQRRHNEMNEGALPQPELTVEPKVQ
jgi:tetratricopeptide (TPR) repeat protein